MKSDYAVPEYKEEPPKAMTHLVRTRYPYPRLKIDKTYEAYLDGRVWMVCNDVGGWEHIPAEYIEIMEAL